MNTDLRIPVTAEQKQLISSAVAHDPGGLAAWARQVLLDAAATGRQITAVHETLDRDRFLPLQLVVHVMDRLSAGAWHAGVLQFVVEAPGGGVEDEEATARQSADFLAAPFVFVTPAVSVDVAAGALLTPRSVVGIVAPGPLSRNEAGCRAVSWLNFEKRCG